MFKSGIILATLGNGGSAEMQVWRLCYNPHVESEATDETIVVHSPVDDEPHKPIGVGTKIVAVRRNERYELHAYAT